MSTPAPEEFHQAPDSYEHIPQMWVDADYYLDGKLMHPARREPTETPPEDEPGWTVQGAMRGEAP